MENHNINKIYLLESRLISAVNEIVNYETQILEKELIKLITTSPNPKEDMQIKRFVEQIKQRKDNIYARYGINTYKSSILY